MSNNYNSTLQSNNTDLQAILDTINNLPESGGSEPTLQDKTVTPTTSKQTITADSGYDGLDTVTVNAIPTAKQATPAITVDSSGLITVSATQDEGYVSAGTKSSTKQLTTQSAKTITPSTSNQTAVSSGIYTTGTVTVAPIPNEYITTTDATASADEIMSGETAYVNGSKVTGTFTIENELVTQDDLISQIKATVDNLPDAGGENLETCTVIISSTNSSYSTITFLEYTTLDPTGKLDVIGVASQDITSPFSIQCVCNTSISGIFPPSSPNSIQFTKMNKILAATAGQVIGWYELTALPNETATITFN